MTLEGAKKRIRQNRDGVSHEAEIVERLRSIRNMLAALRAELGDEMEVIEIDEESSEEVVAVAESAPEVVAEPEQAEEPMVAEPAKSEPIKEQLADFKMEMPTTEPQPEEPKKPRTPKMGTLIGGDLFSPEDIRLAVAKKNSKEAKKQVIEQTLF